MASNKPGNGGNGADSDYKLHENESASTTGETAPEHEGADEPEHAPQDEGEALRRQLEAKTVEAAQNFDRLLRERAELENYKKRAQRERADTLKFANEQLVRDLLPMVDNLERAIEHAEVGGEGRSLAEGVSLVLKGLLDVLARHGVTRIEAAGHPFDPTVHEAVMQVPTDDIAPNQVVQQFQPGYRLHDRLLRPAQVSVSTATSRK
jgi:molecular chaperone GrpE